jgi:acyl-homoserine lactone acylase PvdQ
MSKALAGLVQDFGSLDATYGDRFRVGRGNQSWPLAGGGANGTTTLRNVGYADEREDGTRWGSRGQTSTQVVVMSQPPRSYIYIPLGQSDREDSPHFDDQAEKLFSKRTLKPSWWLPEDLAGNIESRTVLPGLRRSN